MIKINCGTCGTSQGYKTAADGAFSLPATEENRLISRGVAEYATTPVIGPAPAPDSGGNDGYGDGTGNNPPEEDTALEGLEIAGGEDIPDYNADMKADYLRGLLERFEIPCKFGMSKVEMVAALDTFFSSEAAPPELGVEAPVV